MRGGGIIALGLVCAAAVGALYLFGRTQPIVTVERSQPVVTTSPCEMCQGRGQVVCSACGGSGSTTGVETSCPTCKGKGRVVTGSLLRRARPDRALGSAESPCPACRGTGKTTAARTTCPVCEGRGRLPCGTCFGSGSRETGSQRVWRAARAELSWWERLLSWLGIAPDENPPPQVRPDGSVPLVEHHLRLFETPARRIEPIAWRGVRRSGAAWEVGVRIRIREDRSEREEERIVRVQNREVTHVLRAAATP
ncbi:MAG: hypothetical protein N2652_11655 [Kiritimatiellae bacterium]|nr:hypothetical protein [Kiritimatiellia bacterium]